MSFDRRRLLLGVAISCLLLAATVKIADFSLVGLPKLSVGHALALIGAYCALVFVRAASFRALAAPQTSIPYRDALQLAAKHQMLFSIFPSGSGDLGFPWLASRTAGIKSGAAIRMLLEYRVRDLLLLAGAACSAILLMTMGWPAAAIGAIATSAAVFYADIVADVGMRAVHRIAPSRFQGKFDTVPLPMDLRLLRTTLALGSWACSLIGLCIAFATAGNPVGWLDGLLLLAGMNIVGALAVSIAGLGVAELGLTAILVILGATAEKAASIALSARPFMLVSLLTACGIVLATVTLERSLNRRPGADPE